MRGLRALGTCIGSHKASQSFFSYTEGREEVKWELGLAGFCPGKIGFKPLGLGFGHWEWE